MRREAIDIFDPPAFRPGEKVRAALAVRNDGTHPLGRVGDELVAAGSVGYVRDVGSFLQRFHVYAVEFVDRPVVVGMRAHELVSLDRPPARQETGTP